jgi:hypothetical protein
MPVPPAADAHAETQPDRFTAGPAKLTLLPADQVAELDPYMAQIITYRKSGLSLNHIIGCPLNCGYCVRHFWGDFEHKTPHLLCATDEAIGLLLGHKAFRPSTTPIQIFNKATDPFLPAVKPHLFEVLRALDDRGLDNLVLVITRFKVTAADMAVLEELRHLRVTLLFTYSGINDPRIEPPTICIVAAYLSGNWFLDPGDNRSAKSGGQCQHHVATDPHDRRGDAPHHQVAEWSLLSGQRADR